MHKKSLHSSMILIGVVLIQAFLWSIITNNYELMWLAIYNVLIIFFLLHKQILSVLWVSDEHITSMRNVVKHVFQKYCYVFLFCLLLWWILFWLLRGYGLENLFIVGSIILAASILDDFSWYKRWLYRNTQRLTYHDIVLWSTIIVLLALLSAYRVVDNPFSYALILLVWVCCYTVLWKLWTQNDKWPSRKSPFWLVLFTAFLFSLLRWLLNWVV